jgi:hypothetical protein
MEPRGCSSFVNGKLGSLRKGCDVKVLCHEIIDKVTLLGRLQKTRLKGYGKQSVYSNAKLELLEQVSPDELAPTQRYVLHPNLDAIAGLRETMLHRGIDIFALRGGVWIWPAKSLETGREASSDPPIPVLPPIIEESREADGSLLWLINDGIHRVYAARRAGRKINIVLVRDVPTRYPYYAYATPGGWNDVLELDELPDNFQKKNYRFPQNYKALFRDFDSIFPGVQVQRKRSNPEFFRS